MKIRKLVVIGGMVAVPAALTLFGAGGDAQAIGTVSGPCKVQVGSPGPSVGNPTVTVNPSTGEVYFKAPHVDSGHLDPHVECFSTVLVS
jgi:hypothetical protein